MNWNKYKFTVLCSVAQVFTAKRISKNINALLQPRWKSWNTKSGLLKMDIVSDPLFYFDYLITPSFMDLQNMWSFGIVYVILLVEYNCSF